MHANWWVLSLVLVYEQIVVGYAGDQAGRDAVKGDPSEVLIERSKNRDILMLGSRTHGPLRRALLGSVSACVMREAHRPVLVIPRGAPRHG